MLGSNAFQSYMVVTIILMLGFFLSWPAAFVGQFASLWYLIGVVYFGCLQIINIKQYNRDLEEEFNEYSRVG